MGILLGFAPFILFTLLTGISGDLGLWAAFAAAFAIAIRDFAHTCFLRTLDIGNVILFGFLALYVGFTEPGISIAAVRFAVDGGFLLFAFASILVGHPFTLQYMHETVPENLRQTPLYMRQNYLITGVWAAAFAAMTAADAATIFNKGFPPALDAAAGLAALTLVVIVTARYPAMPHAVSAHQRKPAR